MKRPWIVTGAAGFLGSHVVDHLLEAGIPVVGVDDLSAGRESHLERHRGNAGFRLERLDIREGARLTGLFCSLKPVTVVHLAALHFIPACVADPARTVSVNVHGTQCVLAAARASGAERFWFASTGDVYAPSEAPHREDAAPSPFNIYGLSKWQGEQLITLEARARPEARFFVGRLFNLYGARETNPHILPEILGQIRRAPDAALRLGNLWPRRDLVPVTEAARAVLACVEKAPPGLTTANVATGEARSMEEVLRIIGELRGRALTVENDPAKARAVERPHLQADVSRLRALIGWTPSADLRSGLEQLLRAEGLLG